MTMPMPIMDSGIRPSSPAAENRLLPGAANIARYGLGMGAPAAGSAVGLKRVTDTGVLNV
ncbi:hypothetical protein GCM10010394_01360 [Streptomyces crystallinus]|uniref:Uncharacterized protein n=1 Tax=Streptomyces crystallinus TaxID=68191 RepID=A0ABN1EWU1_9ACTN